MALFSRVFEYLDLPVEIADPPSPGRRWTRRGCAARSASQHVGFTYPDADRAAADRRRPDRAGRHDARPGRRDRVGQDARWPRSWPGWPTRRRAGDASTASTCATCRWPRSRGSSASSRRRPTCCTPRSARTCGTPGPAPPTPRSRPPPGAAQVHDVIAALPGRLRHRRRRPRAPVLRRREAAAGHRPHAAARPAGARARRGDQRAGQRDRAGRAGRARRGQPRAGRRSPSRTGCPRSATPTVSPSCTPGGWSSRASTRSCWPADGRYARLVGAAERDVALAA